MFCKNCGNEVNDKAIACPKCGVNPKSEKNFCPACGVATSPNQVICTKCGITLAASSPLSFNTANLPKVDVEGLVKNKALVAAAIGFIGFFLTWIKVKVEIYGNKGIHGYSGAHISNMFDTAGDAKISSILSQPLLYLFPLVLIGIILAAFVPQITKYKKVLILGSVLLIVYAGIGIFTTKAGISDTSGMMTGALSQLVGNGSSTSPSASFSAGFGYYLSLLATLACAYFSGLLNKKQ